MKKLRLDHYIFAMKRLIWIETRTVLQFTIFALIGILNTAIHFVVFYIVLHHFNFHYLIASIIGFLSGVLNSYWCNRRWTFNRDRSSRSMYEFLRFLLVNVLALLTNLGVLAVLVANAGFKPELAQAVSIAFSTTVNFVGNKLWTFQRQAGS